MTARKIQLGAQQAAAINAPGNLLIRAGAGSGKTEVLARRVVALLTRGVTEGPPLEPEAIAAITFTEKAALDMRARIAGVLEERISAAAASAPAETETLIRARRRLVLARISTIHAFCARILRENPVAAGLDPGFEVLDEYESATFFERICRATLVAAVRRGDLGARLLIGARRLRGSTYREGALDLAQRLLAEANRLGRDAAWILAQAEARAAGLAQAPDQTAACAHELAGLIDELVNSGEGGGKLDRLRGMWPSTRPSVLGLDSGAEPAALDILRAVCAAMPDARSKETGPTVKLTRELVAATDKSFQLEGALIAAWGERLAVAPTLAAAQLLLRAERDFAEAKRRERAVTFDDLLIMVRDLLRDQPAVADRYRIELHAILVDEYQDTNAVQDEIIALLTEPRAGVAPPAELFIVGDEKQSIYRFRGADVRVFRRSRDSSPTTLPLAENRRSTPNILNFVNGLSASAMAADGDASAPAYRVVWEASHALTPARGTIVDYPVEIIPALADDDPTSGVMTGKLNAVEKRGLEARAIANRVRAIVAAGESIIAADGEPRPAGYRDIAVLFRAFSNIAIYEEAFIAAGIPCHTVKGRGFYGRREVIDLVELLAAVDDPRDSIALAATLRSPFFALSDNTLLELGLRLQEAGGSGGPSALGDLFAGTRIDFEWLATGRDEAEQAWRVLDELRRIRGRAPLLEIVERALELTDYETVMAGLPQGAQRVANLRKLMDLALRFDALHFFSFHDFVVYLRRLLEEEPYEPQAQILGEREDVVRLMTVHQAKGLEFPIVILADAGRGPNRDTRTVLLDPEGGLLLRATAGSGGDEIPNAAIERYRKRLNDEEAAESVRILYVALTRARDRLIVSEGASTTGWSKILRKFLGAEHFEKFARAGTARVRIEHPAAMIVLQRADVSLVQSSPASDLAATAEPISRIRERLTAPVAAAGAMIMSPTALADFDRCPRQYWLRHGLGLPEPAQRGPGSGATGMGAVAHKVLERLGYNRASSDEVIVQSVESVGLAAGLDSSQRAAIARDLARYLATVSERETIVGREIPFMLDAAPGLYVRGQIDLLLLEGSVLLVRDYKYSRRSEAVRYAVQLQCYALAAATAMPGHAIAAELVTLRDGPQTVTASLPLLEQIRMRLATLSQELQRAALERDYPQKPPHAGACRDLGCGYLRRCWRGADQRNEVERARGLP